MPSTMFVRRLFVVGIAFALAATGTAVANSLSEKDLARARQLVQQLGASNYREREEARSELIRMGSGVEPILREGMVNADAEIRSRSRAILPLAMSYDMERHLQVFLAGKEDKEHPAPAGWPRFKEYVGDSAKARETFAGLHRFDAAFLTALAENPAGQKARMSARCTEFMYARNTHNAAVSPEEVSLLLFASLEPKLKLDAAGHSNLSSALHGMSYQPRGKEVLRNHAIVRKLLVRYIAEGNGGTDYNGLYLVANLELKEGADIARKIIARTDRDPLARSMAIAILGKLGDKSDIPNLVAQLSDQSQMGETQLEKGQRLRTQVRDVALVSLVQLTGQALSDYNFTYLKMLGGNARFNVALSPGLCGFADDAVRDAALKRWNEWYEKNKNNLAKK